MSKPKYKVGDIITIKQEVIDTYSNRDWANRVTHCGNKITIHAQWDLECFSYNCKGTINGALTSFIVGEDEIEGYYNKFHNYNLRNK